MIEFAKVSQKIENWSCFKLIDRVMNPNFLGHLLSQIHMNGMSKILAKHFSRLILQKLQHALATQDSPHCDSGSCRDSP